MLAHSYLSTAHCSPASGIPEAGGTLGNPGVAHRLMGGGLLQKMSVPCVSFHVALPTSFRNGHYDEVKLLLPIADVGGCWGPFTGAVG